MKANVLLLMLCFTGNSILLSGQNDSWLQKGYDAPNSKEKIICFTKSIEEEGATVEAYFCRAGAELEIRDYQGAIGDYTRIIEMDPNDAGAYYSRGFARHHYIRDYRGALSDYSMAFEMDSTNASYVLLMGVLNSLLEDYPDAIACFKKGLQLCNDNIYALNIQEGVGITKTEYPGVDDRTGTASADKRKRIQPNYFDAILGLALAYYHTNDPVNAKKYFGQAIELMPGLKQGVKGLESLEKESCVIYPKDDKALKKMLRKFK